MSGVGDSVFDNVDIELLVEVGSVDVVESVVGGFD